ncbi:triacylglycerol lipase, partial [Teladorsagia circumcincta]
MKRQVDVTCGAVAENGVCSGFTAVAHRDKANIISFRGTKNVPQLLAEIDAAGEKVKWIAGGFVSKYFNDGFMGLWTAGMKEDFRALRVKYPEYELWVTGHSLGGAMASLAASYIIAEEGVPSTSVKMVTFGQPRVGDYQYAKVHDTQIAYSFRVTHWRDMVPHLPPKFFMGYYHHESE